MKSMLFQNLNFYPDFDTYKRWICLRMLTNSPPIELPYLTLSIVLVSCSDFHAPISFVLRHEKNTPNLKSKRPSDMPNQKVGI